MAHRENRGDDWTRPVPRENIDQPFDDIGWELHPPGSSEFRDPEDRLMGRERRRAQPWRPLTRSRSGDTRTRWENDPPGRYTGMGPRGYQRSNERIYEDVCERMTLHGQLDASDIEIEVSGGEVTLKGTVKNRRDKRLAEDIAESVSGVRDIHNQLRLSGVPGGGAGRWEDVSGSGVYPTSGPLPQGEAEVKGMASWGQGERGAERYHDHGDSELRIGKTEE